MAVITKTNHKGTSDAKPFPKLMIGDFTNVIVLFSETSVGTVVERGANSELVGYFNDEWDMPYFKDYDGEITLSNE